VVLPVLLPLGRCCPLQTCDAAFEAAGGGRLRIVVAILPEDVRSFGFARNVLSIPPAFFSGLGVRALV